MSNYEDHWMDAEQVEPRVREVSGSMTGRFTHQPIGRSIAQIIEAYQNGESMTDAEVEQVYHALVRLENAVCEVGGDLRLVFPWVIPKRQSFEGFMKHRAERREKEKARIAEINKRLHPEMFEDPNTGWGPWLSRRDAPYPFQNWCPFAMTDYVEVCSQTSLCDDETPTNRDYVKYLWWGWTKDSCDAGSVIRRARKWVGPGDPPK